MGALPEPEMRVHRAVVVRVEDLTPSLKRVVLGGPGLSAFESTGVGDEYVRVLFPADGETEPVLPEIRNGVFDYAAVDLDLLRTYTVRAHDPCSGEVTIDFVVHEGGVASTWARRAEPGDVVGLNTPTGMYDPPVGMTWQILVADCAALPALSRILEQTDPGVRCRVVVEVPDAGHQPELPGHRCAEITWVHGGNGHGASRLTEVVESIRRPKGVGYVWVSGETRELRGVRRHLRRTLGLPASAYRAVGYWTENAQQWNARYQALDDETRTALSGLWDSDRSDDEIEEEYDERLTALGL